MKSIHSPKGSYFAAFLLGGLLALLLAAPARSAEFRLDRVSIVRFSPTPDGRLLLRNGVLGVTGEITWRGSTTMARPDNTPDWALNRDLVSVSTWLAFHSLGSTATANFEVLEGGMRAYVGDQPYLAVGVSESADFATGDVVNISTRARLGSAGDLVIAGFVIQDRPRTVLVRAVGPGLARFNVPSVHPDPWLAIKRQNGETIVGNDDWSNQPGASLVATAAARVGAFPLDPGSLDAAKLEILPPGVYTVHVGSDRVDVSSREVLVEVYSVPEDVFDAQPN